MDPLFPMERVGIPPDGHHNPLLNGNVVQDQNRQQEAGRHVVSGC